MLTRQHEDGGLYGWPRRPDAPSDKGRPCVIGAPSDHGNVVSRGAALGPAAVRYASQRLQPPRLRGYDWGDVERSGAADPAAYMARVSGVTADIRGQGLCPLLPGGDHSLTYAQVSALQREQDLCLLWFDAHTDFRAADKSP
ncbi:arginase family protein [Xanthomonas theicola]|uniref:Arginase n=1 Tax=Xanthomonas theicola TaxID=56464 RepID=A0A2S6ZK34_9XANT|nr:arginase family protein [Xanthomonas theicola]PPT92480.1 hypothetical protein XthCFBP4691_03910 [Xanthomonas theicola]QNH26443.1 arginase family protein [Xanthomonas theicola]